VEPEEAYDIEEVSDSTPVFSTQILWSGQDGAKEIPAEEPPADPGDTFLPSEESETAEKEIGEHPPQPTGPLPAQAARRLGEKKRFIAVMVMLSGPADSVTEGASMAADIAYKLDGILHHEAGGELLVLFGLPSADEHDIVAAVRFALDCREALANLDVSGWGEISTTDAEREVDLEFRIGIKAGSARLSANPAREGYQLLGNVLRDTEILASHGSAGQVLIAGTATTLALPHYSLQRIESLTIQAKAIRCHAVIAPRSHARQAHTEGSPPPFLGRDVELRAIKTAWREAVLQGVQRSSLVIGEAGIGKSVLMENFLQGVSGKARVVAAAATPHHRDTPNGVLIDLLQGLTGAGSAKGRQTFRNRLRASLRVILGAEENEQSMEALVTLLTHPDQAVNPTASFNRQLVHTTMRKLLNKVTAPGPTIIAIEDLHWADNATIQCITDLITTPDEAESAVFFLITTRLEENAPPMVLLHTQDASLVLLDELDEQDRRQLIQWLLGPLSTPALASEVERRAGGNPFYIRELARAINDIPALSPSDIPPTVQRIIAGRVDRLPADDKTVLQHAAVIGPIFREGILARLIKRNPAVALATLRNSGIIVPWLRMVGHGKSTSRDTEQFEREWAFRNILVQEVVYEAISPVSRRNLHQKIGQIMARRVDQGSSDRLAEVARHLEVGGDVARAGEFTLRAAHDAAASFAGQDALKLYCRALLLTKGDPRSQYAAHAGQEQVHAQLGMHREQAEDLAALHQFCEEDDAMQADLRNREALYLLRLGEIDRALDAALSAEQAALQANDTLARGEALRQQGEAYERQNRHDLSVQAINQALEIFEQQGQPNNQIRARISLGRSSLVRARYDEAFSHYEPALELIKETKDRWQERILRYYLAVVHYCRGDFAKALGEALYSLNLCEQFGDVAREGDNAAVVGLAYMELGQYESARQYLQAAVRVHQQTGSQWGEADTHYFIGLAEIACRQYQAAMDHLDQAKVIARRIGAKSITMNARNAMAMALCERDQQGDGALALEQATKALEFARSAGLIVGEIPGLCRQARAALIQGDLEQAIRSSANAVELLEEQRIIETPEEEIYYTHYRILQVQGDQFAPEYLQRAYKGLKSKADRLMDTPEWEQSFLQRVLLNAAILRDYQELVNL